MDVSTSQKCEDEFCHESQQPIRHTSSTVTKLGHTIEGMDCSACARTIENHLKILPLVTSVSINFPTGKMMAEHDNSVEDIINIPCFEKSEEHNV